MFNLFHIASRTSEEIADLATITYIPFICTKCFVLTSIKIRGNLSNLAQWASYVHYVRCHKCGGLIKLYKPIIIGNPKLCPNYEWAWKSQ
jgi:hypothetical protein